MVSSRGTVASSRTVTRTARLIRGVVAAHVAVASAALAHSMAGHHTPHPIVIVLALAVSVPVCVALSSVRLSRIRLAAAVLVSQAALHGLFALLPAPAGATVNFSPPAGLPHAHGLPEPLGLEAVDPLLHSPVLTAPLLHSAVPLDAAMTTAHLLAAGLTFALLRRGEVILYAITDVLTLRPVLLLLSPSAAQLGVCSPRQTAEWMDSPLARDVWPGDGAGTLRGPPVVVN